jgi:Flp pilus assembly pilin Flp
MKSVSTIANRLWKDESGQGATEYILLLVVVVGLAMLFKNKIMEIVGGKLSDLARDIGAFQSQ